MIWERPGRTDIRLLCKFMTFDTDWIHALLLLPSLLFSFFIPTPNPFHLARWIEPLDSLSPSHRDQKQWQSFNQQTKSERQHLPQSFPIVLAFPFFTENSLFIFWKLPTKKNRVTHTKKKRVVSTDDRTVWPISVSMMDRRLDKVLFLWSAKGEGKKRRPARCIQEGSTRKCCKTQTCGSIQSRRLDCVYRGTLAIGSNGSRKPQLCNFN